MQAFSGSIRYVIGRSAGAWTNACLMGQQGHPAGHRVMHWSVCQDAADQAHAQQEIGSFFLERCTCSLATHCLHHGILVYSLLILCKQEHRR